MLAHPALFRFGEVDKVIKKDGFNIDDRIFSVVEGNDLIGMSKTIGLSIIELSNILREKKPDLVVAIADRYENLSVSIAASYMNIPVAHIQGGETTGSIDEKIRHATKKCQTYILFQQKGQKNLLLKWVN